jgi:hypothetical protein
VAYTHIDGTIPKDRAVVHRSVSEEGHCGYLIDTDPGPGSGPKPAGISAIQMIVRQQPFTSVEDYDFDPFNKPGAEFHDATPTVKWARKAVDKKQPNDYVIGFGFPGKSDLLIKIYASDLPDPYLGKPLKDIMSSIADSVARNIAAGPQGMMTYTYAGTKYQNAPDPCTAFDAASYRALLGGAPDSGQAEASYSRSESFLLSSGRANYHIETKCNRRSAELVNKPGVKSADSGLEVTFETYEDVTGAKNGFFVCDPDSLTHPKVVPVSAKVGDDGACVTQTNLGGSLPEATRFAFRVGTTEVEIAPGPAAELGDLGAWGAHVTPLAQSIAAKLRH